MMMPTPPGLMDGAETVREGASWAQAPDERTRAIIASLDFWQSQIAEAVGGKADDIPATISDSPVTDANSRSFEWWRDCHETDPQMQLVDAQIVRSLEQQLSRALQRLDDNI